MANICDNTFYAYSEDKDNIKVIKNYFEKWPGADCDINDGNIDIYFNSKWDFPKEEMDDLFKLIPNKKDIYMRCLSVEYGCMYHALWECNKDGWKEV